MPDCRRGWPNVATDGGRFYRVFENLDELVSVVETARGVLVSGSCVVPRGHVLDLLDDLREALPAEMEEAHAILEQRTDILVTAEDAARRMVEEARAEAAQVRAEAQDEAEQGLALARGQAESMLAAARTESQALAQQGRADFERAVTAGQREHDRLVSEMDVHQSAHSEAERLLADSSHRAAATLAEASARADRVSAEADEYVEGKLAEFAATLTRTLRSVEAGRGKLRERQPPVAREPGPEPYDQDSQPYPG
ncbi:MAG: DivIVA domain-containing protein [Geodermatophilaceae bacterium]|nr:DivIVA domain-containing protein [Geodermatophilaceae bacterium]